MSSRRLVIIDGYALLYRAFFATRYLSTSDGRPTNALFGFTSMLFGILEKVKPDAIVVALDAPGKTFRHAEYEGYKATRKETQPELKVQLNEARNLIAALGVPSIELIGFEADDVVGTISKQAEEQGYRTTIVTGDLDALQLVDDFVEVMTPKQGVTDTVTYDIAAVEERYGFGPTFVPDFKALKGDTSDNIPGVPGIGDKGAADLIQKFGTIEAMLERIEEVEPKYRKKIEGNEDQMRKSKWLATIIRDVPIEFDFEPFRLSPTQVEAITKMLESFEFRQLVRRAGSVFAPYLEGADKEAPVVEVVQDTLSYTTEAGSFEAVSDAVGDQRFALFLYDSGPKDNLFDSTRNGYIALGGKVWTVSEEDAIRLFRERTSQIIGHDIKPLYKLAPVDSIPAFDTVLAAYVLRSDRASYPLRDLVQGYLDVAPPTDPAGLAAGIYHLERVLTERLLMEDQLKVLNEIELPVVPILAEMERYGISTDRDGLREFSKTLEITIEQEAETIFQLAGQKFTIGSPKQIGEILFEKLGIKGGTKNKTGWATGVEVLGPLAPENEIIPHILSWRELTKLKSTYADSLQNLIQADGRIHTTYNQAVAATGRLSSNDPNLQNIPIRTELGRGIRKAFHAASGYQLASLDYSQIELRVLAHLCKEPALVHAFESGEDVHSVTAQQMFGLGTAAAGKDQRRLAKMLNYAVLYGVSEFGLAQQLGGGFSISEAKELIRLYNERFPTVKEFTNNVILEARSKGFTTTLRGRRRYFPDIHAARINDRKYAERQAMNAPIQGAAADMMKLAMIAAKKALVGHPTRMLLNVHDELVFEMKAGDEGVLPGLRVAMEQALPLEVPVECDAKVGPNWNDMTPVAR